MSKSIMIEAKGMEPMTGVSRSAMRSAFDMLAEWRQRTRERRALAQLSARDLTDLGIGHGERIIEVEKPFWRA
jgi:uncharacterized protein YjiS (DUF1127 family)